MVENPNTVYIKILVDTLEKKKKTLQFLMTETKEQERILRQKPFSMEDFNGTLDKKERLIAELNQLDDGFEAFYQRLELVIQSEKKLYKEELLKAQGLISEIMDLSMKLQALEARNKERLAGELVNQRQEIRSFKASSQAAEKYYHNMANQHQEGQSYFLDRKK